MGKGNGMGRGEILMGAMEGEGKRAYPRYAIDAAIEVRAGDVRALGRSRNISRGGLCVELDRALPVGGSVDLAIKLVFDDNAESEPLAVRGRVSWSTPMEPGHQIGLQFEALRPRDIAFLDMFLRYLEERLDDTIDESAHSEDPFA